MKKTTEEFIRLNGFKDLTNVQKKVKEFTDSLKDVIAISKTGTGKTHAYLIPVLRRPRSSYPCRQGSWPIRSIRMPGSFAKCCLISGYLC